MKTIVIYCRSMELGGDPFSEDYYWQAYQDLLLALKSRGVQAYFASGNEKYTGDGWFSSVYGMSVKAELDKLETVHNVRADVVFDRGGFAGTGVTVINHPDMVAIADDKIEMYRHFGRYQPKSIECSTAADLERALDSLPGEKIVVKDPHGRGGHEVFIGPKSDVPAQAPRTMPLLAQEFLDTSGGVPGVSAGVHDVRLSICGGTIIGYYIRQAAEGALHSNVSRGGTMLFHDVSTVPSQIARMAQDIDSQFSQYPRYYAADFMHTEQG